MKFPLTSSNPKASNINSTTFHHNQIHNNILCYEPTSVLDLRRTPSPIATAAAAAAAAVAVVVHEKPDSAGTQVSTVSDQLPVQWDENFDDWDSIMRDLGLHDDDDSVSIVKNSTTTDFSHPIQTPLSDFNLNNQQHVQNVNYTNIDFDLVEELIRGAGCFDSGELQLAQVILSRLNQRLRSPVGKPLQRATFYFKEALTSLLTYSSSNHRTVVRSSSSEIVSTIKAYKVFSAISPVPMFSNFTANQAVLEAVEGSMFIHLIDFDIGFGGQYASFMKEIADRSEVNCSMIRVTAVVTEDYATETRLIRDNLCQFAQELRINLHIEFVSICAFETSSFKSIKFIEGEKVAVLLSPTIIRRVGYSFFSDLRRISPGVIVFIDEQVFVDDCVGTSSLRRAFVEGLEYYSMMLESLDAAAANGEWVRKIETCLLRQKIKAVVEAAAEGRTETGREAFIGAGMRPVVLSQFAEFQAECLLRKAQVRGFHVAKRQGELLLCWNGRPMVATSAWRC